VKRQQVAPKKVYCIDTGLANTVGFSFSPNTGRLLENCVYLALRRTTPEVYYLTTGAGAEVDFYLPQTRLLLQVTQSLSHAETRQREVRALSDAMGELDAQEGIILTEAAEAPIETATGRIIVQSVARWLLTASNKPL
jgi:predicted AAA+ superfamily ATPase